MVPCLQLLSDLVCLSVDKHAKVSFQTKRIKERQLYFVLTCPKTIRILNPTLPPYSAKRLKVKDIKLSKWALSASRFDVLFLRK